MTRKQKKIFIEKIKDLLKLLLLIGFITTLWVIASLLASLV